MSLDKPAIRDRLQRFDFSGLFTQELGWDFPGGSPAVTVDGKELRLKAIAQKRGVQIYECPGPGQDAIPEYKVRRKVEREVAKSAYEQLIIFTDGPRATPI